MAYCSVDFDKNNAEAHRISFEPTFRKRATMKIIAKIDAVLLGLIYEAPMRRLDNDIGEAEINRAASKRLEVRHASIARGDSRYQNGIKPLTEMSATIYARISREIAQPRKHMSVTIISGHARAAHCVKWRPATQGMIYYADMK